MKKEVLHIYTRVSTVSQKEKGHSLDYQKDLGITKSKELKMDYQIWDEGSQSGGKDDLSNLSTYERGSEDGGHLTARIGP